jgi:hypothetical protein
MHEGGFSIEKNFKSVNQLFFYSHKNAVEKVALVFYIT